MPRPYVPNIKVEVIKDGVATDVTSDVISSEFRKMATIGIGDFRIKLNNAAGQYSNTWAGGETVRMYANNNADATTERFEGILDYPKDTFTQSGQVLDLEGRHISASATEVFVTASYDADTADVIIKDIIDTFLTDYTYANVNTFTANISVRWSNKPLWECVKELAHLAGADVYVDDDKDFHMFDENSIFNDAEAVVEGAMPVTLTDFGKDTYFKKTKVRVAGDDGEGIPVLRTATIAGSGDTREIFEKDASVNTYQEATDRAQALADRHAESTLPPQGRAKSYILYTLQPGDNIWISVPRQRVHGVYKVTEFKHIFGRDGLWTEALLEREMVGTSQLIRDRIKKEHEVTIIDNPNRMEHSYNFPFNDDSNISSSETSNVGTSNGALKLIGGNTSGTMVSNTRTADNNITSVELRIVGADMEASTFEFSVDNGASYQSITKNTATTPSATGNQLKIKVNMASNTANPTPILESLGVLYI